VLGLVGDPDGIGDTVEGESREEEGDPGYRQYGRGALSGLGATVPTQESIEEPAALLRAALGVRGYSEPWR
jgi:hypothetical protein